VDWSVTWDSDESLPWLPPDAAFFVQSGQDPDYNCIAWALGSETEYIWPVDDGALTTAGFDWDDRVPRTKTVDAFVALFKGRGFDQCLPDSPTPEGHVKIALFAKNGIEPAHAARQCPDGSWTSKFGDRVDASHELAAVESRVYGKVVAYFLGTLQNEITERCKAPARSGRVQLRSTPPLSG
jgi:hypothetical protein